MIKQRDYCITRRFALLAFGLAAISGGCGGGQEEKAAPAVSRQEMIWKQMADNEEAQRKAGKLPKK
jgi:hypothetical protein